MAYRCLFYARDSFKSFLHMSLTVPAHHPFDLDRLCHFLFLLILCLFYHYRIFKPLIFCRVLHLEPVKPESVRYHAEARKAHGRGAKHRVELQAEQRIPHARRQRDPNDIVNKRPEQVLMDIPQSSAA